MSQACDATTGELSRFNPIDPLSLSLTHGSTKSDSIDPLAGSSMSSMEQMSKLQDLFALDLKNCQINSQVLFQVGSYAALP